MIAPGAATASGFGTLAYRAHGPVSVPVDGQGTVNASCRPDSHVLGGGQFVQAGFRNALVHSSAPFDGPDADEFPDDGWRSRVDSFNGAHNTVTEYAICSTRQPRYRKDSFVTSDLFLSIQSVGCPAGDTVLGGGLDISPEYNSGYVLASAPGRWRPRTAWRSDAFVGFNAMNQRVTAWAICGAAEVIYRRATGEVADQGSGRASAACPAATRLIGGGVRVSLPDPRNSTDLAPTIFSPVDGRDGDLAPDDRWQVEADDLDSIGGQVEATAVCIS